MDVTRAEFKLLEVAEGDVFFWEILLPSVTFSPSKGLFRRSREEETQPPLALADAQAALRTVNDRDWVQIYETTTHRLLATGEAHVVIADEVNWLPPLESGRETLYEAVLTEAGEAAYKEANEHFRPLS